MKRYVPLWVWLALAAIFILAQVLPCLASDQSASFWSQQPCGFKEVELDSGDVPKEIWMKVAQINIQDRDRHYAESAAGRIFSISVKYQQLADNCRVRYLKITRGGKPVYSGTEKVCR